MPRKYPREVVTQAVALASIVGAEEAAKRMRLDPRTVRAWLGRAGKVPADSIAAAAWASLGALARAQVQADLPAGKVPAKTAAIIGAIADRNTIRVKEDPARVRRHHSRAVHRLASFRWRHRHSRP